MKFRKVYFISSGPLSYEKALSLYRYASLIPPNILLCVSLITMSQNFHHLY